MSSSESGITRYLRKNPGADFIVSFLLALMIVAFVYHFDRGLASEFANLALVSLMAGIILQGLSLRRNRN
jgi:uncharacterized membrane protein